jgi:hypothetical protein
LYADYLFSGDGNLGFRYANNHQIRSQPLALGPPLIDLSQSFTDREVTLLGNHYHKNRSMHETWLVDPGCNFADDATQAMERKRRENAGHAESVNCCR